MGTFELKITMGNETMQTTDDLTSALEEVSIRLSEGRTDGAIRDMNGNTVGYFLLEEEKDTADTADETAETDAEPVGEVVRTYRVRKYDVGSTGRLYSARVQLTGDQWRAFVTCTHLDGYGHRLTGWGRGTVVCRALGLYSDRVTAEHWAKEGLRLWCAGMSYTVEELETND